MCKTHTLLEIGSSYNWDGDCIVHDTIVPRTRQVVGTKLEYELDIRELLLTDKNALIRKVVDSQIKKKLPAKILHKFVSKEAGSFDFRMSIVQDFIENNIGYMIPKKKSDPWMYPEETLKLGYGDCEDRALLLASLALGVGISPYNIRVALGKIKKEIDSKTKEEHDHVWVMYKNELGHWVLIDPNDFTQHLVSTSKHKSKLPKSIQNRIVTTKQAEESPIEFSYRPYFVFNTDHLWMVANEDASWQIKPRSSDTDRNSQTFKSYIEKRKFWNSFHPSFASAIHSQMVSEALKNCNFMGRLTVKMRSDLEGFLLLDPNPTENYYIGRLAHKVVWTDITLNYDARLHFDNAQIDTSLDVFHRNMLSGQINDLASAIHAIQDFYAHTTYASFAKTNDTNNLVLANIHLDRSQVLDPNTLNSPIYDAGLYDIQAGLDAGVFSQNTGFMNGNTTDDVINHYTGKIISGRYGQPNDSKKIMEYTQFVDETLPDIHLAAGLPHHNEIAIDDEKTINHVFTNTNSIKKEFNKRYSAAQRHTKLLVEEWLTKFGN
jgi:Transglutaminase-like superfamily